MINMRCVYAFLKDVQMRTHVRNRNCGPCLCSPLLTELTEWTTAEKNHVCTYAFVLTKIEHASETELVRPIALWAAIPDMAASIGTKHQLMQSDRYMLPTSALTRQQQTHYSSACAVPYTAMSHETWGKMVQWCYPASFPIKTIIWFFSSSSFLFAGVASAMFESEGEDSKRRTVRSWISLKILYLFRLANLRV